MASRANHVNAQTISYRVFKRVLKNLNFIHRQSCDVNFEALTSALITFNLYKVFYVMIINNYDVKYQNLQIGSYRLRLLGVGTETSQ